MLADIKKMLGINNSEFDDIINSYIDAAKLDLKECGIVESKLNISKDENLNNEEQQEVDKLIYSAIISYVKSFLDIDNSELFRNSYNLQKDALRHISSYIE